MFQLLQSRLGADCRTSFGTGKIVAYTAGRCHTLYRILYRDGIRAWVHESKVDLIDEKNNDTPNNAI